MNTTSKGNRNELLARKDLQSNGYIAEKKNRNKYESPDFWGLFDILAIKGVDTRLIQVKSNPSDFYKARKEIAEWQMQTGVSVVLECWLKKNRTEWRKEKLIQNQEWSRYEG